MAQTSFPANMVEGAAGLIADQGTNDIVTRINGEASASLPFGVAVIQDTANYKQALEPAAAASGAEILGFTVRSAVREHDSAGGSAAFDNAVPPNQECGILRSGRMYVETEEAMAIGDDVFVRVVAAGAERLGTVRSDADGTDARRLVGARVVKGDLGQSVPMCIIELAGPLNLA